MHVLSVVGARPQFVKLAPIHEALVAAGARHTIVHTGQHYDSNMSEVFFDELAIPAADVNLGVGSGSHGAQTATMLAGLETVFLDHSPDWVLVYGDTNSTVAAALAAVKIHLPLAHLEAGLRSFNRRMPEEHNRVLTDHASDLLLAPSTVAVENLANEGLAARTRHVGDVMVDIAHLVRDSVAARPPELDLPPGDFALATIHRAENTDDPARLAAVLDGLAATDLPVVLAAHPRLVAKCAEHGLALERPGVTTVPPLPYRSMVAAVLRASQVITDSGGLQKEAFVLGTPCVTVRTETEWLETVQLGANVLVSDPTQIAAAVGRPMPDTDATPYGDGHAATAAVQALLDAS